VLDVLRGNPQFSLLHQLVQDAALADALTGSDPVTLFAPTNESFDALPADAVARLRSDPELLERVLGHHLVQGGLLAADLVTGPLVSAAGDQLDIGADGEATTVDGASIVEPDVLAGNGVVHAVDALLLPDDVDLTAPQRLAAMTATFADGGYLLEGVVRSEVERAVLVVAATAAVGATAVTDALIVDPDLGLDEPTAQALATLVTAVADSLVTGAVAFDGEAVQVTGTYADDAGRSAVEQAAAAVGAQAALVERPAATDADADQLEADLNAFVAANPILFEPSSSVLDESALPILDEVARRAGTFTGVTVTVEGHTDSDGGDQENLVLSQLRAVAVQQALVERGLDPTSCRPRASAARVPSSSTGWRTRQPVAASSSGWCAHEPPHPHEHRLTEPEQIGAPLMPYTLSMALLWVSLAVLLGIVVGWLMRSVVAKRQIERARSNHLDQLELERLRGRVSHLEPIEGERDRLREELDACRSMAVDDRRSWSRTSSPARTSSIAPMSTRTRRSRRRARPGSISRLPPMCSVRRSSSTT
jgi:outer membrane protein OmpA-like peptidoglycan-associated protein